MGSDPIGEIFWRSLAATLAEREPFTLKPPPCMDMTGVINVVDQIIEQFRFLIEDRRFLEELYNADKPRPEKAAQRLFYAVAYAYCKANNLDLTPEAETGNGPVAEPALRIVKLQSSASSTAIALAETTP